MCHEVSNEPTHFKGITTNFLSQVSNDTSMAIMLLIESLTHKSNFTQKEFVL